MRRSQGTERRSEGDWRSDPREEGEVKKLGHGGPRKCQSKFIDLVGRKITCERLQGHIGDHESYLMKRKWLRKIGAREKK